MRTARYRIVSGWQVPGHIDAVAEVFREPERLEDWWPAAFLDPKILYSGAFERPSSATFPFHQPSLRLRSRLSAR